MQSSENICKNWRELKIDNPSCDVFLFSRLFPPHSFLGKNSQVHCDVICVFVHPQVVLYEENIPCTVHFNQQNTKEEGLGEVLWPKLSQKDPRWDKDVLTSLIWFFNIVFKSSWKEVSIRFENVEMNWFESLHTIEHLTYKTRLDVPREILHLT